MAARRGAQSLTEALHGLTLSLSATASRKAGQLHRRPSAVSSAPTPSQSQPHQRTRPFSTSHTNRQSESPPAAATSSSSAPSASPKSPAAVSSVVPLAARTVPVTVFAFPSLEPRRLEAWPAQYLALPLRRDLLHLAVVYEGDNTRQGTASSKTRYEVHGSHRKLYPQKGSGRARVGNKQSPLRMGGGKTFGPKPRDFGTDLPRKMYDRAWRTALSYRYRRGELVVAEDGLELPLPDAFLRLAAAEALDRTLEDGFVRRYVRALLHGRGAASGGYESEAAAAAALGPAYGYGTIGQAWGRAGGRTTFITTDRRPNLFTSLETAGEDGRALTVADVDVKDLLETGRLVVERAALAQILEQHQSDLVSRIFINGVRQGAPAPSRVVVE